MNGGHYQEKPIQIDYIIVHDKLQLNETAKYVGFLEKYCSITSDSKIKCISLYYLANVRNNK